MSSAFKPKYAMYQLLELYLEPGDGGFVYANGWSDERLAKTVQLSVATVRQFRTREFGPLNRSHAASSWHESSRQEWQSRVEADLSHIKARLTKIEMILSTDETSEAAE